MSTSLVLGVDTLPSSPSPLPTPIIDVDGKSVQFKKPGVVTIVLGCSEDTQTACRQASYTFDQYRGRPDLRLIVIVDLRGSLAGLLKDYVRERMQKDLDAEAGRLRLYYQSNHNEGNPRDDLCAIPDFNGAACRAMGWNESIGDALHAVVYGPDGKEAGRWNNLKSYSELVSAIKRSLPQRKPSPEEMTLP